MARRSISSVSNMFIYHDKNNRTIYWDVFTKKGYYLQQQDVGRLMLDKATLPIAVILAYALINFKVDLLISILIGVAVYIIGKILWRVLFLYKHQEAKGFVRGSTGSRIDEITSKYSKLRLYALIGFCLILIALTIYCIATNQATGAYLYVFIIMAVAAFILLILAIAAIIYKNKNNK